MNSFSNPIPDLIQGLLQGHELGMRMHKQQQEDQAFQTNQALRNQQMSMQDIMNQQTLQKISRPVSDMGTVDMPAGPDIPDSTGLPGMGPTKGAPGYHQKADASRTITYGGKKRELMTPDEQQQGEFNQEVGKSNALFDAQQRHQEEALANSHRIQLAAENGGAPSTADMEKYLGLKKGTMITSAQMTAGNEAVQKIKKGYETKLGQFDSVYSDEPQSPGPGAAPTVPTGAQQGAADGAAMAALSPTAPFNPFAGLDPKYAGLQGKAPVQPTMAPAAVPGPALPDNPTVNKMRLIAQGVGEKKLNDQESYVEAAAQALGKTTKDLTGTEKLKFITEYKHDPAIQAQQRQFHEDSMGMQRQSQAQSAQAHQDTLAAQQRTALDRETALHGKAFDEISKGADSQLDKILDAEKMVSGGAVQQALGIPKVLTAVISGQGSGVRITKSEMDSIAKARGLGGDIEGFFNKLSGNGQLTTQQKAQMQSVLGDVRERIMQKKAIARQASDEINNAPDRAGVLAAEKKGRDAMDAYGTQQSGGKISVKAGDGSVHPFDTEQQAKAFEQLVKAKGGTTSR